MNAAAARQLTRILLVAAGMAGLGLLVLLGGWARRLDWGPALPIERLPVPGRTATASETPPLSQFSAIWSRPLLEPDRHPAVRHGRMADPGHFELTGVILTPALKMALLQPRSDGGLVGKSTAAGSPGIRVALGARIAGTGWLLLRLDPRRAWFMVDGREQVLELAPAASRSTPGAANRPPPGDAVLRALERLRAPPPAHPAAAGTE
ncbi:hypothetical protein ACYJW8_10675 [Frateuria aurantia]